MFVIVAHRPPQMPGVVRAGERLLHLVVHARRDAVHHVGFIQLATHDGDTMKPLAQKPRRIDEHGSGSQGDQELLRRGPIQPLDLTPNLAHQLQQRVAGLPVRPLHLSQRHLLAGREVTTRRDGGGIKARDGLALQFLEIVAQLLDGPGSGGKLVGVHLICAFFIKRYYEIIVQVLRARRSNGKCLQYPP